MENLEKLLLFTLINLHNNKFVFNLFINFSRSIQIKLQGANSHGQLGLGTVNEQVNKPTKITCNFLCSNKFVKQISCGGGHTALLDNEGNLFSCGWNNKYQLGKSNETSIFERVWDLSGINFVNIACGWDFSCGVTDSKLLIVWGSNSHGQLGLPIDRKIVKPLRLQVNACAVSMGLRHTAIINSKGEVWITGCGRHGQLGLGQEVQSSLKFQQVPKLGKISHIACGQNHTISWSIDEKALYVWGDNRHGQLLLSSDKYMKVYIPQKIDIDVKQTVKKLLSGWTNGLIWLENGELLTWGRNNCGQLGTEQPFIGKIIHVKLPDNREVKDVALGSEHTVCLATDNTLWSWGWNEHANTGTDCGENVFTPSKITVNINENAIIKHIFSGGAHNFVILEEPAVPQTETDTSQNSETSEQKV